MTEFSSPILREHYFRTVHKSGLTVCIFPKKLTTAYAFFAVRFGSTDNAFFADGKKIHLPSGVAHFLEHKLFENEDGSDTCETFAALGADVNAYTTYHQTAYLFSATEHFEESLCELLRFVTHPHLSAESVKRERGIITEEIREYDDSPWDRAYQLLLETLYHQNPIREQICGTVKSIRNITPDILMQAYRAFYRPDNMVLSVAGDVDPDTVMQAVDRMLPQAPTAPPVERIRPEEPRTIVRPYAELHMPVAKPIFCIGIKDTDIPNDPAARLYRDICANLLCEILFSRSDPFYNTLFEEGILNPSFSYGYTCGESCAFVCLSGEADNPKLVLDRMWQYLDSVRKNGIDEEAFERCRRTAYADELRAYDSTEEIGSRLLTFSLDGADLFSCPDILASVTKAELERLLSELFLPDATALAVVINK